MGQAGVGTGFGALREGFTPGAIVQGGIAGAVPFVGAGLGQAGRTAKQALFGGRQVIPTTPTQAARDIARGLNIGEAISGTGISLSRKSLLNKLGALTGSIGKELDEAVKAAPTTAGATMQSLTRSVRDKILNDPKIYSKLGATPIERTGIQQKVGEILSSYNNLFGTKKLTVPQLQALKVDLGSGLKKEFQKAVGAAQRIKPATEMELRNQLKKAIEKFAPATKEINKKLSPLIVARDRLASKGQYSGYLTDIIAGSAAATGGPSIFEDPGQYIQNALSGVALKRGLTSTAARTGMGTLAGQVEKLSAKPEVLQILREMFSSARRSPVQEPGIQLPQGFTPIQAPQGFTPVPAPQGLAQPAQIQPPAGFTPIQPPAGFTPL